MTAAVVRASAAALLMGTAPGAAAEGPIEALLEGGALAPRSLSLAAAVVSRASLERTLPAETFAARPQTMEALFDHPRLTADVVRGMGWGDFRVEKREGEGFSVSEAGSIEARFTEIYRAEDARMWLIEGQYYGSFFVHLAGSALLLARYRPSGASGVEVRVAAALGVESRFYGFLVALFRPFFESLVDRRFARYMSVARRVSEAVEARPLAVYNRLAARGALTGGEEKEFTELFLGAQGPAPGCGRR